MEVTSALLAYPLPDRQISDFFEAFQSILSLKTAEFHPGLTKNLVLQRMIELEAGKRSNGSIHLQYAQSVIEDKPENLQLR